MAGGYDARVLRGCQPEPGPSCISWLGRLSDNELAALLRDSLCLAFPSLTEGFGLPALEAMALGCPVVVSDRASLPEVCADAALYAAPTDGEAWLNAFLRLRNDFSLRGAMAARGRKQAARFSWSATAEIYLREMARLDGLPGGVRPSGPDVVSASVGGTTAPAHDGVEPRWQARRV
jgi:glycosyltransferase involved in cell wall biosynthesis